MLLYRPYLQVQLPTIQKSIYIETTQLLPFMQQMLDSVVLKMKLTSKQNHQQLISQSVQLINKTLMNMYKLNNTKIRLLIRLFLQELSDNCVHGKNFSHTTTIGVDIVYRPSDKYQADTDISGQYQADTDISGEYRRGGYIGFGKPDTTITCSTTLLPFMQQMLDSVVLKMNPNNKKQNQHLIAQSVQLINKTLMNMYKLNNTEIRLLIRLFLQELSDNYVHGKKFSHTTTIGGSIVYRSIEKYQADTDISGQYRGGYIGFGKLDKTITCSTTLLPFMQDILNRVVLQMKQTNKQKNQLLIAQSVQLVNKTLINMYKLNNTDTRALLRVFLQELSSCYLNQNRCIDDIDKREQICIHEHKKEEEHDHNKAEQDHKKAEQDHKKAEQDRNKAEQDNKKAEQDNKKAEQDRNKAEQDNKKAEQDRNKAEQDRNKAEQDRNKAEQDRNKAEQDRNKAEQDHKKVEHIITCLQPPKSTKTMIFNSLIITIPNELCNF
jgi:hypothetical protein